MAELNKALDSLYKHQISKKKEVLSEFQSQITCMMKEIKMDVPEVNKGCQTDESLIDAYVELKHKEHKE